MVLFLQSALIISLPVFCSYILNLDFEKKLVCEDGYFLGMSEGKSFRYQFEHYKNNLCIVGGTGTGKTYFIKKLIKQFLDKGLVYMIDLKGVDYFDIKDKQFFYTYEDAYGFLERVWSIYHSRIDLLKQNECGNYQQYSKKVCRDLKPIFFIIEEFSFIGDDKKFVDSLVKLGNVCRACNIKIILSSQKLTKVFDTRLRANLMTLEFLSLGVGHFIEDDIIFKVV